MAGRSRMNREVHVRFCEGVGVKFPRATRRAPRGCAEDEGGPLGVGLQEQEQGARSNYYLHGNP